MTRWFDIYFRGLVFHAVVNAWENSPLGRCVLPKLPRDGHYMYQQQLGGDGLVNEMTVLKHFCTGDYDPTFPNSTCIEGRWSAPLYCARKCQLPNYEGEFLCYYLENPIDCYEKMMHNTIVHCKCLESTLDILNCNDGKWNKPFPECKSKQCLMPQSNSIDFTCNKISLITKCNPKCLISSTYSPHGVYSCNRTVSHSESIKPKCKEGFVPDKNFVTVTCTNGNWENLFPTCKSTRNVTDTRFKGFGCELPDFPAKGSYNVSNYNNKIVPGNYVVQFTVLEYYCEEGYNSTSRFSMCEEDNSWSSNPTCKKQCRMLTSFSLDFTCYDSNDSPTPCYKPLESGYYIIPACKQGLILQSDSFLDSLVCDDGKWDHSLPKCIPECGIEKPLGTTHIINAPIAVPNSFPWHMCVYQDMAGVMQHICGGSLLRSHIVISAAHCFFNPSTNQAVAARYYRVAAGKYYRSWDHQLDVDAQKLEVKQIFLHDRYKGFEVQQQYDVALLELIEPFTLSDNVRPICYDLVDERHDSFHLRPNNTGMVAGWGTTETGSTSEELRYLTLPVIDFDECYAELVQYNFQRYLTVDKYCAGYRNGTAVCRGDSGGGMVFFDENYNKEKRWFLRGIVSTGPLNTDIMSSCRNDTYTAFTHVFTLRDWINAKLRRLIVS